MTHLSGPYPRVAEALIDIFTNAVARWGKYTEGLILDRPCTEHSNAQWQAFMYNGDSVAFISWCADKIRYWHMDEYMQYFIQAPLYGVPESFDFAIMSPDGQTDWTLAAWHVHKEIHKETTLRFILNIDGSPIISKSHTHPSHSEASRLKIRLYL
jgi:hypothetical protein